MAETRRFPAPWTIDEHEESFAVRDASGFSIAYVYFTADPERRASTKRMSRDEAWRIAVNMARLPELLADPERKKAPEAEAPGA